MLAGAAAWAGPLRIAEDPSPPALAALGPLGEALGVTLSADGKVAAAAFPHPEKSRRSLIRIASADGELGTVAVRGTVEAMRFGTAGQGLFVLARRLRGERVLDAYLGKIDLATFKAVRAVTLPDSARGLDLWTRGSALLVASLDEVRSVLLPEVRTGPLFWIPGQNLAVAVLGDEDRVLVGQEHGLVLVNLGDPQGRDPLPTRDRVSTEQPVIDLVASPGGRQALARLADGRVFRVTLDPLRLEEWGRAPAIAWVGERALPAPPAPPASTVAELTPRPAPPPAPPPEKVETAPRETPPPARPPEKVERTPREVAPAAPAPAKVEPAPREPTPPAPSPEKREAEPAPEAGRPGTAPGPGGREDRDATSSVAPSEPAAPAASETKAGTIEGRITGPAAAQVTAVVLLGPDNVLREAARVPPTAEGSWRAVGLVPGRYRVLLDGGGKRVLVAEPPVRDVRVEAGGLVRLDEFRVLRSIDR